MIQKENFLKELKEVAKQKRIPIEKAFIHWYITVAFGDPEHIVTDGPSDGGIDAIVRPKRVGGNKLIYVLQSKYTESFFRKKPSTLSPTQYIEFDNLPSTLSSDEKFNKWLETVNDSLKEDYRLLRKDFSNKNNVIDWRFITLHSRTRRGENRLQNLQKDSFQ